jgi:hypothetical protein
MPSQILLILFGAFRLSLCGWTLSSKFTKMANVSMPVWDAAVIGTFDSQSMLLCANLCKDGTEGTCNAFTYDMDICTLANLPYLEDGELISDPKVNYFIPNNGPCHLSGIPLQKGKNPTAWLESE